MFDFITAATAAKSPKDALERANFAVQDKLGRFMSLGNRVISLRDRATSSFQVENANAIIEGITKTQARALSVLSEAKEIQESMAEKVDLAAAKSAVGVAQDLLSINAEMDALISKSAGLEREIGGLAPAKKNFLTNVDPRFLVIGGLVAVAAFLYYRRKR